MALILDSVTHLGAEARGCVALCASHGGIYAAGYAAMRGVAAVLLHDAGIGRERAGVAGLDTLTIPAAACGDAPIGDGAAMMARGTLSVVNAAAARLGLHPGMRCADALALLVAADLPPAPPQPPMQEARHRLLERGGVTVWGLDSNGLVVPSDIGHIIVTGSHGALLGGRPETAVKYPVRAAIYNDAGGDASRLPVLDDRGIAGAVVSCFSARIGDALSIWNDGYVSAVNRTAAAKGGLVGQSCREIVDLLLDGKT
ncbi:hypothetical protein ACQW02_14290 [Humitalea sp. 24SJ18S-53]|uniref:hypothetical protein n=1 Tax=Humitalea sp. 24SJ18S-53 TaxID=3422307 RepID=UPI003D67E00C